MEKHLNCIYGAGLYGKILSRYINKIFGGGVDYFVQTQEPPSVFIDEIPVISLKALADIKADKHIFIAMNNTRTIRQIEEEIYDKCSADNIIQIYNCRNFINDNLLARHITDTSGLRYCTACGNKVEEFLPFGIDGEIFLRYHIIGGGYRKNGKCPYCGAIDRTRWLYYVLDKHTDISAISGRVLHFAPEGTIEAYIRKNAGIDYYSGDIVPGKAMHVIDITDIPYKDGLFDYVISSHILEHIEDEARAVSEIKRVLKKDGKWIFSFPICAEIETYEDREIDSPEKRLISYGQEDHVRLYGNDFVERFGKYGLKLEVYSPQDELNDEQIDKYGFIRDDIIIVATQDAMCEQDKAVTDP